MYSRQGVMDTVKVYNVDNSQVVMWCSSNITSVELG